MNKYVFLLAIALFPLFTLHGQVANYEFDNSLESTVNDHNATYIVLGQEESAAPEYLSVGETTSVFLDSTQSISLPASLVQAIDTSKSLEISFSFVIEDIGFGGGFKNLWNCQSFVNEPGMGIFVQHDEFSDKRDFDIYFVHSDGGFNQLVPNHIGHDKTVIGRGLEGDVMNVTLVMDFEKRSWSSVVNGEFISNTFNTTDLIWDTVLKSLVDNPWYFGWYKGQEFDMEFNPDFFSSSLSLDYLEFYSPRQDGNTEIARTALEKMTAYVQSTLELTYEERLQYLNQIFFNFHNNFSQLKEVVFAYTSAYEEAYPPVYEDRQNVEFTSLEPEAQLLIFLQQDIFDNEVRPDNVEEMEGINFEFSDLFPGPVDPDAERIDGGVVEINGTYAHDPAGRIVADLDNAKRPIGYYAAPGEIVIVEIDASLIDAGLAVQVGAHHYDLSSRRHRNRYNRMSKVFPLSEVSTKVINPFGGALYLQVPEGSDLGWIDITVSGAVKSPYFSWRTDRQTDISDWNAEIEKHSVEWVDLESDGFMMTLPLNHVKEVSDPSIVLEEWDEIVKGYQYLGGRPNEVPRSLYFAIDSRLPADAFGTGYPQIIGDPKAPFGPFGAIDYYPTHVLQPEFWNSAINTTFHEFGHAALHPTLFLETESIVHVPATYVYNKVYGLSINEAFKYSSQEFLVLEEAAMDWMIADNFRNNRDMDCDPTMDALVCDEVRYQHRGHAKYADMARMYSWESVYNMNHEFYKEYQDNPPLDRTVQPDDVIRNASISNGVNMAPLFHFWGVIPSESLIEELSVLPSSTEIKDLLHEYYNIIPETQADFLPYRDRLLERKDPVHHDRVNAAYENFETEGYADAMKEQICNIIGTYYLEDEVCGISNTDELVVENKYEIVPNPSSGIIEVKSLASDFGVEIYNSNGAKCFEAKNLSGNMTLDLTNLPNGVYQISLGHGDAASKEWHKLVLVR